MNPFRYDPKANSLKKVQISSHSNVLIPHRVFAFTSFSMLLVIIVYIWLISFGSWFIWPVTSNYYDQLATAFEYRSLSIETKPSRALLALPDPYDPGARAGINYPKDFSLYNGKYYLYFGPVPALILAIVKSMGLNNLGDQDIVFAFVSGIFIFQSLLIIKIWRRFFQKVPLWIILACVLFGGLVSPFTWILTQARVYEAAASSGQFFFLAGFYFGITALEQKSATKKNYFFLIVGISWALAIGSRLTQILPISFLTLVIAFFTIRTYRQIKESPEAILAMELLGGPLVLGIAVLARYNWARFHSVFETGLSYQLAGSDLQKYSHVLFSPLYILPNLYNYLVMAPGINRNFPFLESVPGTGPSIFSFITLPDIYFNNVLTGILFSTPFVLFASICITAFVLKKKHLMSLVSQADDLSLFKGLIAALAGSFLFGFVPFTSFFWVASHYQTDFIPSLVILSIIGFWQGYICTTHKPDIIRKLYVAIGIILIVASIIISILLVLSAHVDKFQKFNPIPWEYLVRLFSR
jgi:hypothetical protein